MDLAAQDKMSVVFTEEQEKFLKDEMKEIWNKLAILLEMDSAVTAIPSIESEDKSEVLVASNTTSEVIRSRQKRVRSLIKNMRVNEADWTFFSEVCKLHFTFCAS